MDEIAKRVEQLTNDTVRGASLITIDAVELIAQAALFCTHSSEWPENLLPTVNQLTHCKPSMASLINACNYIYRQLSKLDNEDAYANALSIANEFNNNLTQAIHRSALSCSQVIPGDARVLTCSSSSSVAEALQWVERVVIYAPDGDQRMAKLLATRDIPSELVSDIHFDKIDCAVIGCDAITPSDIINGTPSLAMAKMIYPQIPLYVVGQRIKEIEQIECSAFFDRIPKELISSIFTE